MEGVHFGPSKGHCHCAGPWKSPVPLLREVRFPDCGGSTVLGAAGRPSEPVYHPLKSSWAPTCLGVGAAVRGARVIPASVRRADGNSLVNPHGVFHCSPLEAEEGEPVEPAGQWKLPEGLALGITSGQDSGRQRDRD